MKKKANHEMTAVQQNVFLTLIFLKSSLKPLCFTVHRPEKTEKVHNMFN